MCNFCAVLVDKSDRCLSRGTLQRAFQTDFDSCFIFIIFPRFAAVQYVLLKMSLFLAKWYLF